MTDKAERLLTLAQKMKATAAGINKGGNNWNGIPFAQGIQMVSSSLGFESYVALNDTFLSLCSAVGDEVATIELKRDSVRDNWKNTILHIRSIFVPDNFASPTVHVFTTHFSDVNFSILETVSERLQSLHLQESTSEELSAALQAVDEAIKAIAAENNMDKRIVALLRYYVVQLRSVIDNYELFGEAQFWNVYKQTFATFMQVHSTIAAAPNSKDIVGKIWNVLAFLALKVPATVALLNDGSSFAQLLIDNSKK